MKKLLFITAAITFSLNANGQIFDGNNELPSPDSSRLRFCSCDSLKLSWGAKLYDKNKQLTYCGYFKNYKITYGLHFIYSDKGKLDEIEKYYNGSVTSKCNESGNLSDFVPDGYFILSRTAGNLNLDSIMDMALVLGRKGEDTLSSQEHPLNRKLLILFGQMDKTYKLAFQNENVVCFYGYDLNFKDAFTEIQITAGMFTVNHYGGFRYRWGRGLSFSYNTSDENFYLTEDTYSTTDVISENLDTETKTQTVKDFGKINFTAFDIYK